MSCSYLRVPSASDTALSSPAEATDQALCYSVRPSRLSHPTLAQFNTCTNGSLTPLRVLQSPLVPTRVEAPRAHEGCKLRRPSSRHLPVRASSGSIARDREKHAPPKLPGLVAGARSAASAVRPSRSTNDSRGDTRFCLPSRDFTFEFRPTTQLSVTRCVNPV